MRAAQTKRASLIESFANIAVGLVVSFITTHFVLPIVCGIEVSLHDNVIITIIFTVVSVVRSYIMRRIFEGLHMKGSKPLAFDIERQLREHGQI